MIVLAMVFVALVILACFRGMTSPRAKPLPEKPPTSDLLYLAKRRFIAEMNRRIFREPEISPQLQTIRDMVVGWYEMRGLVIGVRFVAKDCCLACRKLDGSQISLLDIRYLVPRIPPVHRERGRQNDCSCTLLPVAIPRPARAQTPRAAGMSRPLSVR